jgi:hypothetical protein
MTKWHWIKDRRFGWLTIADEEDDGMWQIIGSDQCWDRTHIEAEFEIVSEIERPRLGVPARAD